MKKFTTIEEAVNAVNELTKDWSDIITVSNIQTTNGFKGYFIDMTANNVSYLFLKRLEEITDDPNPVVFPNDDETIRIGIYVITNDSGE